MRDLAGETRAEGTVFVGDARVERERYAGLERGERWTDPGIVERSVRLRAVVAVPLPADGTTGFCCNHGRSEDRLEIEAGIEADLLEEVCAAHGILE